MIKIAGSILWQQVVKQTVPLVCPSNSWAFFDVATTILIRYMHKQYVSFLRNFGARLRWKLTCDCSIHWRRLQRGSAGWVGVGLLSSLCPSPWWEIEAERSRSLPAEVSEHEEEDSSLILDAVEKFAAIFVGGGAGGCTAAYLFAKWMEEANIPGTVLLVDRGGDYLSTEGPNPGLPAWYDNWASFSEAFEVKLQDGSAYPVTPTSHVGIGGASSHDTRIGFYPSSRQLSRMAKAMEISQEQLMVYMQANLNLTPLQPSILPGQDPYFEKVLAVLSKQTSLSLAPAGQFSAHTLHDTIGVVSMQMYPDGTRWTPALLLAPQVRPSNLKVLSGATVVKVELSTCTSGDNNSEGQVAQYEVKHVLVEREGRQHVLQLEKPNGQVVLAAGLENPAILQRSGVGPPEVLSRHGIPLIAPQRFYGTDHEEIAVVHAWPTQYEDPDTRPGGPTKWPAAYLDTNPQTHQISFAHVGADAEPYEGFVMTPNVARPYSQYEVTIESAQAGRAPLHTWEQNTAAADRDRDTLREGLRRCATYMLQLQSAGLVGPRLAPPPELDLGDDDALDAYIFQNKFTAFHWLGNTPIGVGSPVVDSKLGNTPIGVGSPVADSNVVRGLATATAAPTPSHTPLSIVRGLYVGSGSAFPIGEIPIANPSVSIGGFSVFLADILLREQYQLAGRPYRIPSELLQALSDVWENGHKLQSRRPGQEVPSLHVLAARHRREWEEYRAGQEQE
eukprot:g28641.t1